MSGTTDPHPSNIDPEADYTTFDYVPGITGEKLNHRQKVDYNSHRKDIAAWLLEKGKEPNRDIGLSESTVSNYLHRLDMFYRWVWKNHGGYTTDIRHQYADEFIDQLVKNKIRKNNGDSYSESYKRKTANAIEKLFDWQFHERGGDRWEPKVTFHEKTLNRADEFSKTERRKLREAALEYGTIPRYNDLSSEERDRWKSYLAQKLGKPKDQISRCDWQRINQSWKIPSLVLTALDTGLRPVDVENSALSWLRLEKGVLYIPREDDAKGNDYWELALTDQTITALQRWIDERQNYPEYDDSDAIWLNRKGNPYNSNTLNYLLDRLCEEAGINRENRKICWYSIRHSVGTYMANEGSLGQAREQLRHKSAQTTMKYDRAPPEERRNTLNNM